VTTLASLVEEILDQLQGFTSAPDQITFLSTSVDSDDITFTIEDAGDISKGIIEIGDELIWVKSVDQGSGTVTAGIRGFRGTTAAAHGAGTPVRYAPTWTRSSIKREINRQLSGVYPALYGVKVAPLITADATTYQFDLPATAERIVDVRWKFTTVDGWQRARSWEADHSAPTEFTGGRYVSVYDNIPPGSTVQVLYACRPTTLALDGDLFTSTGLDEGAADVITLGVMSRLAGMLDVARLSDQNVQADQLDQPRAIGSATDVANDLLRKYTVRLAAEQSALSTRYPARFHRTR
jgi:hypothetical protein